MSAGAAAGGYLIPQEFVDLRATIRQIAQEQIVPRAPDIDRTAEYPQDIRELLAENDIFGLPFAEAYGGTGTGTLMLQMAVEEIAKADASCALMLMLQELGTLPIARFGSEELKQRFLPRCATGEWLAAFALSEAEAGLERGGDAYDRGARRRRMGHQRHQELDHQRRRRRLLHRLRGDRSGPPDA